MKIFFYILALIVPASAAAQNIKLKKGQQITVTTSLKQDMDMGMAGQMNNDINIASLITVKNTSKKSYELGSTITRITMNMDAMGQEQKFDSDKEEDKDGEVGKMLGGKIGKEEQLSIDNNTGKSNSPVIADSTTDKEVDENNPMAGLMDSFGAADPAAMVESVFFVLPPGIKNGDSWTDSSEFKNNSKIYKNYTLKAISGDIATLSVFSKTENIFSQEVQGIQFDINTSTKSEGEILVDTKTSLIQKMSSVADVTGTMEMMGQSIPITSKMTSLIEIK